MDRAGRWQTLDGYYYRDDTDLFYDPDDEVMERPKRNGAHIWAAYSYFTTWAETATKWIEAITAAKTGNKQKLKTVINTRLGESYEERGESVDAKGLTDLLEDYHFETGIPNGILVITIGVDVQGGKNPRIELEILGHGLEDETWSIDYVVILGDPEQPAVWDHLDDQFTAEEKIEKRKAGRLVGYEWRKRRDRNEALDCRAYNLGALARLNPNLPKIKLRLDRQAAAIAAQKAVEEKPEIVKPVKEPVIVKKPKVKRKRRGGFVRNY